MVTHFNGRKMYEDVHTRLSDIIMNRLMDIMFYAVFSSGVIGTREGHWLLDL